MTDLGTEYLGSQSVSLSGGECQSWDSPGSAYPQLGNNSFCRNSGSRESGPWCYLNAEEDLSESCDVPFCKRKLRDCKHLWWFWTQSYDKPCERNLCLIELYIGSFFPFSISKLQENWFGCGILGNCQLDRIWQNLPTLGQTGTSRVNSSSGLCTQQKRKMSSVIFFLSRKARSSELARFCSCGLSDTITRMWVVPRCKSRWSRKRMSQSGRRRGRPLVLHNRQPRAERVLPPPSLSRSRSFWTAS